MVKQHVFSPKRLHILMQRGGKVCIPQKTLSVKSLN
jgi:hypothetical protein